MDQPRTERGSHFLTRVLGRAAALHCRERAPARADPQGRRAGERRPRGRRLRVDGRYGQARRQPPHPRLALHRRQAGRRRRLPRAARPVRARHRQCLRDRPGRHCAGHARPGLRAPPGRPRDAPTTTYDDGWFGYGKFVPPTPPKPSTLKPSKTLGVINGLDEDDDRPHFSARSAQPGSGDAATPTAGAPASSTGTPASDPDRPTLHRTTSSLRPDRLQQFRRDARQRSRPPDPSPPLSPQDAQEHQGRSARRRRAASPR